MQQTKAVPAEGALDLLLSPVVFHEQLEGLAIQRIFRFQFVDRDLGSFSHGSIVSSAGKPETGFPLALPPFGGIPR